MRVFELSYYPHGIRFRTREYPERAKETPASLSSMSRAAPAFDSLPRDAQAPRLLAPRRGLLRAEGVQLIEPSITWGFYQIRNTWRG